MYCCPSPENLRPGIRYSYFEFQAKEEGHEQIAANSWTADNEKEHAKIFFKLLEGGEAKITGAFPARVIGNTLANLKATGAMFLHFILFPKLILPQLPNIKKPMPIYFFNFFLFD